MAGFRNSCGGNCKRAQDNGYPRYIGSVCAKHPIANGERYTNSSRCVVCQLEATKRYIASPHGKLKIKTRISSPRYKEIWKASGARHRKTDRYRQTSIAYRQSDKERSRIYCRNNSDARKMYMASYRKRPDQVAKRVLRQRIFEQHLSKHATPKWADLFLIGQIYETSRLFRKNTGVKYEVDHIIPLMSDVVCGLHVEDNLRIVSGAENRSKSNKLILSLTG